MATVPDPYRVLGLSGGATLDEVKRAYRRLAKANHPDAAGATALPRFLAIQAAYEQIAGGPAAGARDRSGPVPRRRPSAADPDRADATRRAYGGRARDPRAGGGTGPAGARPGGQEARPGGGGPPRPGPARPTGPTGPSGRGGPTRARPADPGSPPPSGDQAGTRRTRGKATLGSTSYDGADAGPFEPDWAGASWYGTTSGTYWTINPREYADPRKHGPEYQARARRKTAARDETAARGGAADGDDGTTQAARDPDHATSTSWASTARPEPDPADEPGDEDPLAASAAHGATDASRPPPDRLRAAWRPGTAARAGPAPDPATAALDLARALTDPGSGGLRGRVVRALIGWLPIALGMGWLIGELSGCGRFAATCEPAVGPLTAAGQGILLAALVLLPEIAALAAGAALAALGTAVVAGFALPATGDATDAVSRTALGALVILAWLGGLAIGVARRLRGGGRGRGAAGPVS